MLEALSPGSGWQTSSSSTRVGWMPEGRCSPQAGTPSFRQTLCGRPCVPAKQMQDTARLS